MPIKLSACLVFISVFFVAACTSPTQTATPPSIHTQPQGTAVPAQPTIAAPVWTAQLSAAVNSAPFISGELVIAATADGVIHAVQADSGKPVWEFSPAAKVWDASVNGDESKVCAGLKGGQVTCLDALTGQPIWTADLGMEVQSRIAVGSDRVYAPTTLAGSGLTNDYAGHASLFSLNASTGDLIWEAVTDNYILRRPVINGDFVITGGAYQPQGKSAGDVATRIYAFNLNDGSVHWKYESNDGLVRWVESSDNVVAFSAATETVYALDLVDGHLLWQFGPGYWMQFPVMQNGRMYFGSGDENFQAYDFSSGQEIWKHAINLSALNQVGRAQILSDKVWFNSVTGEIYALDVASGEQVQYIFTGKTSRVGGVLSNDYYILGDPDGKLYAFAVQ